MPLVAVDKSVAGSGEVFLSIMNLILAESPRGSMIDLCSHIAPLTRTFGFEKRTYVDILPRDLWDEQDKFVECDVLGEHDVFKQSYDVALCFDGIEHLYKHDGFALLARMKTLAPVNVIFTPLDPWCIDMKSTNPEAHRSVWGLSDVTEYASLVMPNFHERLGIGAFAFWRCDDLERQFSRVVNELNSTGSMQFEIQV